MLHTISNNRKNSFEGFLTNKDPLKLVNQFINLSNNIPSTENDINIHVGKANTAIDRLTTKMEIFVYISEMKLDNCYYLKYMDY